MTPYVYDHPGGSTARFYIDVDYVFSMSGEQPAFWINGNTGIPNPLTDTPAFRLNGNLV